MDNTSLKKNVTGLQWLYKQHVLGKCVAGEGTERSTETPEITLGLSLGSRSTMLVVFSS